MLLPLQALCPAFCGSSLPAIEGDDLPLDAPCTAVISTHAPELIIGEADGEEEAEI